MMKFTFIALIVAVVTGTTDAQLYLHFPRGSNNRNNEDTNERTTNRRLFFSRNDNDHTDAGTNPRGGNNRGDVQMEFYANSRLPIEWTNQNSCGKATEAGQPESDCNILIQAMCDGNLRDGDTQDKIPAEAAADTDNTYGRHESFAYFSECRQRQRNLGLYVANQPVAGTSGFGLENAPNGIVDATAMSTRQNPGATTAGFECAEERDYYPYWGPTPWVDIAIFTNTPERCADYTAKSQNIVPRAGCVVSNQQKAQNQNVKGWIPYDKEACLAANLEWKEDYAPAHNQPAPFCGQAFNTRNNQLGNTDNVNGIYGGYNPMFNWTIPESFNGQNCALRIRYNVSAAENGASPTDSTDPRNGAYGWASLESTDAGIDYRSNQAPVGTAQTVQNPSKLDVWSQFGLSPSAVGANNYDLAMRNNPKLKIFPGNDGPRFQIAIDTTNFFRTFEDRSHTITIGKPTGPNIQKGLPIHVVSIRGKRGNIVQSFPGTEYGFIPDRLHGRIGDYVHVQWTGSSNNPAGNAGEAPAGQDRHNFVMMRNTNNQNENGYALNPANAMSHGHWATNYPTKDITVGNMMGWPTDVLSELALAVDQAGAYVQPQMALSAGCWRYMSTVANNFTNRSHKAEICISETYLSTASMGYAGGHVFSGRNYLRVHAGSLAKQHKVIFTGGPSNDEWESDWVNVEVYADDQVSPHQFHLRENMENTIDLHMAYVPSPFTSPKMYRTIDGEISEIEAEFQHEHGVALAKVNHGGMHVIKAHLNLPLIIGLGASTMFILGAVVAGSVAACRKQAKSL